MVSIALFLTLPLLLSNCVKDNNSLTSTSSDPTAKLAEPNDPWKKLKMSRADKEGLPPDRLESLGEIALQSGDYESSLINFMEILKKNPQRYDLHYKVGVIFLIAGQFEAARKELALVLVHRPEMLQAHEALGLVHLQEKKYPLAIEEFQLVLSQEPGASQIPAPPGGYLPGGGPVRQGRGRTQAGRGIGPTPGGQLYRPGAGLHENEGLSKGHSLLETGAGQWTRKTRN